MTPPPRFVLAALPTPLVRATRLERAVGGGPIWIKRDDLTGFAMAGNKARPLEFLLGAAIERSADVFVVTGSPGSHFCAAAAVAARVAGLDCELLYAGAEPSPAPVTVELARAAGARVRFDATMTREDLDTAVYAHADRLRAAGRSPYPVPRGGATAVGAIGFAAAAGELAAQCADIGVGSGTVVLPTGSGATHAGLLAGATRYGLRLRIVGASVSRPVQQIRERVLTLAQGCARLLGSTEPCETDVEVRNVVGAGFGIASAADRHSAALAYASEGLLLDDTYPAKAMTLLRELAAERGNSGGPLLFWHTGGLSAALSTAAAMARDARAEQPA
jgi:D-cysteine desulfhydrase